MADCFAIFAKAELRPGHISRMSGFSRMALHKWRHGAQPTLHSHAIVSTLAACTLYATKLCEVPFPRAMPYEKICERLQSSRSNGLANAETLYNNFKRK